jgi:hypothetical protein
VPQIEKVDRSSMLRTGVELTSPGDAARMRAT